MMQLEHKRNPLGVVIACLFLVASTNCKEEPTCPIFLAQFSQNLTKFLECSLKSSQPVTLCQMCVNDFVRMTFAYDALKEAHNTENTSYEDGESCHDLYIDQDRLNILQSLYNNGLSLWDKGFCRNCYNWEEQKLNQNLTDIVHKFLGINDYTRTCMLNYNNDNQYCELCVEKYTTLNEIYREIQMQSIDVCFDVQDAMNKTRSSWSRGGCNIVPSSQTYFFIVSGMVCFIPVVFYTFMIIYTKRKEAAIMLSESDLVINEGPTTAERAPIAIRS